MYKDNRKIRETVGKRTVCSVFAKRMESRFDCQDIFLADEKIIMKEASAKYLSCNS